ncbi:MAG: acyl-CoA desaturase [Planctomycetes bacterium]|nr:acyl-CoA desaturase [Planctomycetota bacterium]
MIDVKEAPKGADPNDSENQNQEVSQTTKPQPVADEDRPLPKRYRDRFPHGVNWGNVVWMAAMHAGAVAAFWFITWQAVVLFFVLHWVTACLGVTLGYHRLLTHGSLIVAKPLKYFFTVCGVLSAEGSPLFWVATHRKHHVRSDMDGDPHSPRDGFWWSHFLWFEPRQPREELEALYKRWAPDLYKEPIHRFFDRFFIMFPVVLGILLFVVGQVWFQAGWSFLFWGLCARMVACYHSTWLVNSATHVWGYRNYPTPDNSRNNWWVALLSYGEGWHNNHHAYQRLARHGHRWWELDITYMVIWVLKKLRLAKNVQDTLPSAA